jgi:hypothetical protein
MTQPLGPASIRHARWGPVLIGATAGLFVLFAISLLTVLGAALLGIGQSDLGPLVALTFGLFAGLLFAGYVAGRFTSQTAPGFHGNLAGIGLYGVVAVVSIVAGSPVEPITLVVFLVVAAIIGFAGGVLGGRPRAGDDPEDER